MGGRGSFSKTHGGIASSSGNMTGYITDKEETRSDIRKLFVDELGFTNIYGTENMPKAQLGALAIELKKYEREFGVINDGTTYLVTVNDPSIKGAAALMKDGSKMLAINPTYHSSVSGFNSILKSEQQSGYKTKTNNKVNKQFTYTVRHEYGHLLQYNLRQIVGGTTNQADNKMRKEITSIAKQKYGAKAKNPSGYGSSNAREFFAESFASMTGGNPNAYGKALKDWLNKRS